MALDRCRSMHQVGYNGGLFIRTSRSKRLEESGSESMFKLPAPNHILLWSGQHALDGQGLIYYLGSAGCTRNFVNPALTGCVRVESCMWKKGTATDVTNVDADVLVDSWSETVNGLLFIAALSFHLLSFTVACVR